MAERSLLALLLAASTAGCGSDPEPAVQRGSPPTSAPPPAPRPDPSALKDPSPAAVLERLRALQRLTPDPRFLSALERVDALGGSEPAAAPVVRFGVGTWQVQIGPDMIGMLPQLPGFADQYAMVLGRAAQRWKLKNAAPVPGAAAEPILPVPIDHAAGLLHDIEQRWSKGERTPDDARRAALAYALLCLDLVDELDVADALYGQALAAVALAEAASGQPMAREKALLAALMGYEQSAVAIAQALPEDDAVRQFASADLPALTTRASDPAADAFTRLLALRALIGARKPGETEAFVARFPEAVAGTFPALATAAARQASPDGHVRMLYSALIAMREALGQKVTVAPALRHGAGGLRADADLAEVASTLGVARGQLVAETDRLLAELAAKPGGPWLPADARVAYHEAQVATALAGIARAAIDHPEAKEQAGEITSALAAAKAKIGQQLDRYAKDLVRAEQHALPVDELVKDIRELRELGPGALAELFGPLAARGAFGSAEQQAALALAERCDSRVPCRALIGRVAYGNLGDLVTDDVLRSALVAEAPRLDPELRLRHLRMERDRAGVLAALADTGLDPALRARQLAAAASWLQAAEVKTAFDALVKEAPASFEVSGPYATWLCEQKDFARALRVLDAWFKQPQLDIASPATAARSAAAHTLRARALQGAGKLKEAWAELQPELKLAAPDAAVLARAALVRSAAGKAEEAIALAQKRLEAQPGASSIATLAQVLWEAERGAEAAALLESHAERLGVADFGGPLADAFAAAHADRPAERAAKACGELIGKKLDPDGLRALIRPGALPPEPAFRCHEQLAGEGVARHADAAKGFLLLRAWKGDAEAHAWIEQKLPADQREGLAEHAYALRLDGLLWDFVPDPKPDAAQGAFVWLLRSAALARSEAPRPEWKQRIDQYYATHREALRDRLGLHLLGQLDQAAVWSALEREDDRPECTYVLGLKAELDADVAQAVDWYRETAAAARAKTGEVKWAREALAALRDSDKSLTVLTVEAKARKAAREAAREAAPADAGVSPAAPADGKADGKLPAAAAPDAGTASKGARREPAGATRHRP